MKENKESIHNLYGKYFFLNVNYPVVVQDDFDIEYPSVNHAYNAYKSSDYLERVQVANIPLICDKITHKGFYSSCKRIVKHKNPEFQIAENRIKIMKFLNDQKFYDEELCKLLIDTKDQEIIVKNINAFWGIAFEAIEMKHIGHNHLGKILMNIRQEKLESELFDISTDFNFDLNFTLNDDLSQTTF